MRYFLHLVFLRELYQNVIVSFLQTSHGLKL